MSVNILVIDLYEMCLKLLEDKLSMEKIVQFEEKKGSEELLKKLRILLKHETIKKAIQSKMASNGDIQLMFLTGVGKVWPLVRSHSILNNLQPVLGNVPLVTFYPGKYDNHELSLFGKPVLGNVPLVTFYPGKYDNHELSLFGKFKDANYYRAFRLISDDS
jgi:hypothetical protein